MIDDGKHVIKCKTCKDRKEIITNFGFVVPCPDCNDEGMILEED